MSLAECNTRLVELSAEMEECSDTDYLRKTLSPCDTILETVAAFGRRIMQTLERFSKEGFPHVKRAYAAAYEQCSRDEKSTKKFKDVILKKHPSLTQDIPVLTALILHRTRIEAIYVILGDKKHWDDPGITRIGTGDGTDTGRPSNDAQKGYDHDHVFFDGNTTTDSDSQSRVL